MTCKLTEEQTAAIDRAITVRSWTPENSFGGMYAQGDAPAGVAVTEQNALTYSAVFRAVVLIGEIVGRMPMNVYRFTGLDDDSRERARRHPAEYLLNKKANRRVDAARLRETMTMLALTWGHAEAEIVRNGAGVPTELHLLPPWATKLDCTNGDLFFYRVRAARGGERVIPETNVVSLVGPSPDGFTGYGRIKMARHSIALGVALERFAGGYFGNGARPGGVLKHPGQLSDVAWARFVQSFEQQYQGSENAGKIITLEDGATFEPLPINNNEAQSLESRTFQVDEVARWFGIPPHLLYDLAKATFSNIEEQGQDFLTFCLAPWLDRWQREAWDKLLLPSEQRDHYVEANTDAILRANQEKRYAAYSIGLDKGFLSPNDVRRKENMPPIPGGDVYLRPMNMTPINAPDAPAPAPTVTPAPGPTDASSKQTNAELRGPFVELLTEAAGRALTIQAKAASRAAKKPDAFLASLDGFEKEQRRLTEEIVAPIVRAAVAGLKLGEAPGVLTERVAQQLVGESRSRLLEASGTATPERLLAVVEQEVAGWNQRAAIAADLIFTEGA